MVPPFLFVSFDNHCLQDYLATADLYDERRNTYGSICHCGLILRCVVLPEAYVHQSCTQITRLRLEILILDVLFPTDQLTICIHEEINSVSKLFTHSVKVIIQPIYV